MDIAIIADDNKKELMAQFCIAYCGILSRHHLCATHITGKYIADATGLEIETFLAGHAGGAEQIASRISFNEIDVLFYFRSTDPEKVPSEAEYSPPLRCLQYPRRDEYRDCRSAGDGAGKRQSRLARAD